MQQKTRRNIPMLGYIIVGAAVLAGVVALLWLAGNGTSTVGKRPTDKDITEFYYTYATSTNPPHYQRYRFYREDGRWYFYHETREGDHFPLTEADATVTGTKPLTDEETDAFFACLNGGTVKNRSEHTETGNAGPWLYLYWKGDRDKKQEYAFASLDARSDFEALCRSLRDKTD